MRRPFSTSYLAGEAIARDFLPGDFRDPATRAAAAQAAARRTVAPALIDVLRAQDAALPPSPARRQHIDRLAAGGVAVVATGQQVGLFGGPLYSFYKAASAIAVARALQAETGVPCLPLFWLQTEDHDFDEIAACTVAGADGATAVLTLGCEEGADPRSSIAHRHLAADVTGLLDALAEALGPAPAATEVLALLRAHYLPGRTLGAAFAGLMATLFADEGLLIFDPRQPVVAALAAPVYQRALDACTAIEAGLTARRAALADAGFAEQIALRPDCALLFFHPDGPTGPRFRLQRQGPRAWALAGHPRVIAHDALLAELDRQPLAFSTSALLRPIVQDTLLPTVAYVGGPGEINYFGQLPPVYEHFGARPPLVVPRGRFRCLDARTRRRLDELNLTADDINRPAAELSARLPHPQPPGVPSPADLRRLVAEQITPAVELIAAAALAVDPHLDRAAARTRASVAHAASRLIARTERRLAERDTVTADRLERLRAALCPQGIPQERFYSWPSLAGRHGWRALKQLVFDSLAATSPFSTALRDLAP